MSALSRDLLIVFLLVFPPLARGAVGVGPATLVQLAAIALTGLWAASMTGSGRLAVRRTPLDLPIVLFLGLAGISAASSVYPWASRIQLYRWLAYALVFLVLVNRLDSRRRVLRLAWVIVLFGAALATAALTLPDLRLLGLETYSRGAYGLSLTFVNHNHFAGYLEIVACLGVGLGLATRGALRVLLLGLSAYVAVAVLFSLSRGGILALVAGLVFLAVGLGLSRRSRRSSMLVAGFLALVLAAAAGLGAAPVLETLESLEDPLRAGGTRLEFWRGTLDVIAADPWSGSGPGTYVWAYNRYQTEATARWLVDHAHNDYLELAAEVGLPGLLAALLGLGVLFSRAFARLQPAAAPCEIGLGALAGCFALAVHSSFEFHAAIPSNALLFCACAALAIAAGTAGNEVPAGIGLRLAGRWRWPVHAGLLLLAIAGGAAVAAPYLASRSARQAREAAVQGQTREAEARLRHSLALDPGNGEYPARLGDLNAGRSRAARRPAERRAALVGALEYYRQAIAACPVWSPYFGSLAGVLERLGRYREAEEALDQAARLAPMDPRVHRDLGRFHLRHGRVERGLAGYRRFLELAEGSLPAVLEELWPVRASPAGVAPAVPRTASARRAFAAFLFARGETESALAELETAFALEPTLDGALLHLRALAIREQHLAALAAGHDYLRRFGSRTALRRRLLETYLRLGRSEQAIAMVADLLIQQPDDLELLQTLADLQRGQNRPHEAIRTLRRGLERRPDDAGLHAGLARLHAALDQPGEALEAWKQAVALQPREPRYCYRLGEAYRRLGLSHQAAKTWRECLEIDPEHRASRLALARLLEKMELGE